MAKKKQVSKIHKIPFRPAVVSVLGHIDHGKTSLLDRVRKTSVAASETGGITQHIGAYQVVFEGQKITFIDTPGHAAFAKMRARGAEVTDLALLVIAGNDGVKPQTIESLKYIQAARIPFLVVVNKMDLPASSLEKVAQGLAKENVLVEQQGGQIVMMPVSAKTGEGIESLLEMILLITEMNPPQGSAEDEFRGVVIESGLDRSRGPVATVLVKQGSLKIGQQVWAEGIKAKIKAMFDFSGQRILEALPSQPVEILGFISVPPVGSQVTTTPTSPPEVKKATKEVKKAKEEKPVSEIPEEGGEDASEEEKQTLKLILKADTQGTLEAVNLSLPKEIEIISQEVGDVNESDVLLAQTTGASLIGFNVNVPGRVKKLAQVEKVNISTYEIIYELLEALEKRLLRIMEPTIEEEILGEAEILQEFTFNRKKVAGCRVTKGRLTRGDRLHLKRGGKILADARPASLKKGKQDVDKVETSEEFGILLSPQIDFEIGDVLVSFRKLPQKDESVS